MTRKNLPILVLLAAVTLLWGCGGGGFSQSGSTNVTVSVGSVPTATAARPLAETIPTEVASLRLTVSSTETPADMTPIVSTIELTPGVSTYQVSVTVLNGTRRFLLEAFDNTSALRYRGDATMVLTGGTASLTIQMYSDVTPPSILSVSPASGATDVALSSPITVTFSEAMDNTTVTGATFTVTTGGTSVPGTVICSGTSATFTPAANWNFSTSYTVSVTTGAEDLAGNAIANAYSGSFTTVPPVGTVSAPGFSPIAGTYTSAQSVTLSTSTPGATIRYTTNGSTPTSTTGTVYSVPVAVSATTTIKAIAYQAGWTTSSVASATYTITGTVATPGFSPAAGAYTSAQSVTISTSTPGATIRYTTDGSTPTTTTGTVYSGAIAVSATTTINAIAYLATWTTSSVASATYTITLTFSQAELAGNWDAVFFDIGRNAGWWRGAVTINGSGSVTGTSGLQSDGTPSIPVAGSHILTISSTGVVTESGSDANASFHGQMSSNKQLIIGTEDWGTDNTVTLRVFRKRTGTVFTSADMANKTLTVHILHSGTDNEWFYGAGTTDGTGLFSFTSAVKPSGPVPPEAGGVLSVNSVGIVTTPGNTAWYGLMTDDKKVIFWIDSGITGTGYSFGVFTITGQTYAQSDYAGTYNWFEIRNIVPNPGWAYGVSSIDASGAGTNLSSSVSGGIPTPGNFALALSATGVVTDPANATAHGQMSYNKDITVRTNTSGSGRHGMILQFRQ